MAQNRQLISSYVVADPETGEVSGYPIERTISRPETISFPKDFCKIHHSVYSNLTDSQICKVNQPFRILDKQACWDK